MGLACSKLHYQLILLDVRFKSSCWRVSFRHNFNFNFNVIVKSYDLNDIHNSQNCNATIRNKTYIWMVSIGNSDWISLHSIGGYHRLAAFCVGEVDTR